MTTRATSLKIKVLLGILSLLGIGILAYTLTQQGSDAPLIDLSSVNKIDLKLGQDTVELELSDRIDFKGRKIWLSTQYNRAQVLDKRANSDLIRHLLEILSSMRDYRMEHITPESSNSYGMENPRFALSVSWSKPEPGQAALIFGNKTPTNNTVYLYMPVQSLLTQTSAAILDLTDNRTALDFRDRHIMTMDSDDIMSITTSGLCGNNSVFRDGDRWEWKAKTPINAGGEELQIKTEEWVRSVSEQLYDGIDESGKNPPHSGLYCSIIITDMKQRKESAQLYKVSVDKYATTVSHTPGAVYYSATLPNAFQRGAF